MRPDPAEPPGEDFRHTNVTIDRLAIDLVLESIQGVEASSSCAPPEPGQPVKPCVDTVVNPVPADAPLGQVLWMVSFILAAVIIWVVVMRRPCRPPQ